MRTRLTGVFKIQGRRQTSKQMREFVGRRLYDVVLPSNERKKGREEGEAKKSNQRMSK